MADTSYGGTSLARALAACPLVTPLVGQGDRVFNPIHAEDLAETVEACLFSAPGPGVWEVGGPTRITQAKLLGELRAWMGLPRAKPLPLGLPLARAIGTLGDTFQMGPISRNAGAQLAHGVEADEAALTIRLGITARGVEAVRPARPAGTQDLWHARL